MVLNNKAVNLLRLFWGGGGIWLLSTGITYSLNKYLLGFPTVLYREAASKIKHYLFSSN